MKNYILLIILSLIFINSCKKDDNGTNSDTTVTDQIFPLKVGNSWIIQVTNYDSVGSVIYSRNDTIKILRDTVIYNERWFIGYGIIINRIDGLYDYQPGSSPLISRRYKFPATIKSVDLYRSMTDSVISISDTITTVAGKYLCYHYRIGISNWSFTDWYLSPNVGIVKAESYNTLASGTLYKYLKYELIKANVQ